MRIAGIDENGLGPRLGPLIVTGVVLEMPEVLPQKRAMTLVKRHGFDDSKRVCGFGHMQQAESRTLVLLEELWGQMPKTYHDLVSRLVGEGLDALMRPCPSSTRGQCWSNDFSLPCFDAELEEGRKAVAHLRKKGIVIQAAQSHYACARRINEYQSQGISRFHLDLQLMCRLADELSSSQPARFVCGQAGGIRDYVSHGAGLVQTCVPSSAKGVAKISACTLQNGLAVEFMVDADQYEPAVAIASMIGKYLREVSMRAQHLFYGQHMTALEPFSGYRDPRTRRFIEASEPVRRHLAIESNCFIR